MARAILLSLLLAASLLPAATTDRADVALLWKGKELWAFGGGKYAGDKDDPGDWKSMAGSYLGFEYAGRGPLPKPQELVIPLEKPLPLGAYRLFVKNFYVGKMDATLGDITKPLAIRRYDWTPGELFEVNAPIDKITLRFFPSNVVTDTGAKQSQGYILQGVFLTSAANNVPIRGGEIVTTVVEHPPEARPGNLIPNGGFEVGLHPWGKTFGYGRSFNDGHNIDRTSPAAEGKVSFRAAAAAKDASLETKLLRLPAGKAALSFDVRAEGLVELSARIMGLNEDLKGNRRAGIEKDLKPTNQWQRVLVEGELKPMPGSLYNVQFTWKGEGMLWLDGVQLEHGQASGYRPHLPAEVGVQLDLPGHILYQNQPAAARVRVHRSAPSTPASLPATAPGGFPYQYSITDYWGQRTAKGFVGASHSPATHPATETIDLPLPVDRCGLFRLRVESGPSVAELLYSVLPPNPHLNEDYPAGTLGTDATLDPAQLAVLKRANFNWVLSKFAARWYVVEPQDNQWKFDDAGAKAARDAKVMLAFQLLNIDWGMQPWLKEDWKPPGGAAWPAERRKRYMDQWADFVFHTVDHYKPWVRDWEIENEPNSEYSAAEYAELLKLAVEHARKADPSARIVAFSGGGFPEPFYEQVLAALGAGRPAPARPDAFSVHFYGNVLGEHRAFAALLKRHAVSGWNTETGNTCPSFFTVFPEHEALSQRDTQAERERQTREAAIQSTKNYLLSLSVGGMSKWFHYFSRGMNAGPSQPTARFGSGKELTEFDGSLRANAVALSVASHMIDGSRYEGPIDLGADVIAHIFARDGGSVGFLWSEPAAAALPAMKTATREIRFCDIMGNRLDVAEMTIGASPVYVRSDLPPAQTVELLKATQQRRP